MGRPQAASKAELERILANLEARVNKMLAWQSSEVATEAIHVQVQKSPEKKAQPVTSRTSEARRQGRRDHRRGRQGHLLLQSEALRWLSGCLRRKSADMLRGRSVCTTPTWARHAGDRAGHHRRLDPLRDALKRPSRTRQVAPMPGPPSVSHKWKLLTKSLN